MVFHFPTTSVIFTVVFVIVEGSMTGTGGGGGGGLGVTITLSVMKSEYWVKWFALQITSPVTLLIYPILILVEVQASLNLSLLAHLMVANPLL